MKAWHGIRQHQYGEKDGTMGVFKAEQYVEVCVEYEGSLWVGRMCWQRVTLG